VPPVIETDNVMRFWLYEDRLHALEQYVKFIGIRGDVRWSRPEDFDVFCWAGDWFEIQGYDAPNRRWWLERVIEPPKRQVTPKGVTRDPRADW
jgi:hypothetical protein